MPWLDGLRKFDARGDRKNEQVGERWMTTCVRTSDSQVRLNALLATAPIPKSIESLAKVETCTDSQCGIDGRNFGSIVFTET